MDKINLEQKVMKKIYKFESRRTYNFLFKYILFITVFLGFFVFLFSSIVAILRQQKTLDLLDLFQEDWVIIRRYFWDTLYTFYLESPKILGFLLIIVFLLLLASLLILGRNYTKIKKKLFSIRRYSVKE